MATGVHATAHVKADHPKTVCRLSANLHGAKDADMIYVSVHRMANGIPFSKKIGNQPTLKAVPINEIDGRIHENTLSKNRTARQNFRIHLILRVLESHYHHKTNHFVW
jgi:hypothetical protein